MDVSGNDDDTPERVAVRHVVNKCSVKGVVTDWEMFLQTVKDRWIRLLRKQRSFQDVLAAALFFNKDMLADSDRAGIESISKCCGREIHMLNSAE